MAIQLLIDGTDCSEYVIESTRHHSICDPIASLNLVVSPELTGVETYDPVVYYEHGTKVFTGYVGDVKRKRLGIDCQITCYCPLKKAADAWLTEQWLSNGESAIYWIRRFLNLAGITNIGESVYEGSTVFPGYGWSNQSALQAITDICKMTPYQIFADADGKVWITQIKRSAGAAHTVRDIEEYERHRSDSYIRNRIVVFGNGFAVEKTSSNPYLQPGEVRTAAVGTGQIYLRSTADRLASKMLAEFSNPLDIKTITIEGDPDIWVGDIVDFAEGWTGYSKADCVLVELSATHTAEGYRMELVLDKKCVNFWGWDTEPIYTPFLFAGTYGNGPYRAAYDGFDPYWQQIVNGLSASGYYVNDIRVSGDNTVWLATDGGLYKSLNQGDLWTPVALPYPAQFGAGDLSIVGTVVPAPSTPDRVYVLKYFEDALDNTRYTCYIYHTEDAGVTWSIIDLSAKAACINDEHVWYVDSGMTEAVDIGPIPDIINATFVVIQNGLIIVGADGGAGSAANRGLWLWDAENVVWVKFGSDPYREGYLDKITNRMYMLTYKPILSAFPTHIRRFDDEGDWIDNIECPMSYPTGLPAPNDTGYTFFTYLANHGDVFVLPSTDYAASGFPLLVMNTVWFYDAAASTWSYDILPAYLHFVQVEEYGDEYYGYDPDENTQQLFARGGGVWAVDANVCPYPITRLIKSYDQLFVYTEDGADVHRIYRYTNGGYVYVIDVDETVTYFGEPKYVVPLDNTWLSFNPDTDYIGRYNMGNSEWEVVQDDYSFPWYTGGYHPLASDVKKTYKLPTEGRTHCLDVSEVYNKLYAVMLDVYNSPACEAGKAYPCNGRTFYQIMNSFAGDYGGVVCDYMGDAWIFGNFGPNLKVFYVTTTPTSLSFTVHNVTATEFVGPGITIRPVFSSWMGEIYCANVGSMELFKYDPTPIEYWLRWKKVSNLAFSPNCGRADFLGDSFFIGNVSGATNVIQKSDYTLQVWKEISNGITHSHKITNVDAGEYLI